MKHWIVPALLALSLSAIAAPAAAEPMNPRSWGVRAGYRLGENDFDQLVVGVHGDLGDIQGNVRFAPNVTLGFGSDATVVSLNPDFQYVFRDKPMSNSALFYLGGGPSVTIVDVQEDSRSASLGVNADASETRVRLNVVAGIETHRDKPVGAFGELRVSFVDGTWIELLGGINLFH